MDAYVEHLVREQVLVGLDAVISDFDFSESRPKARYPKDAPIPIGVQGVVWETGKFEGKLQIDIAPCTPWFRIEERVRVMQAINQRLGDLAEITLYDGSRWRQFKKSSAMYHRTTPDEPFDANVFYERLP